MNNYDKSIHRLGRISGSTVLLLIILVPAIISIYYSIFPPVSGLLKGLLMVCMVYIPISIAEFLTYTPMLGRNASYLAFVTGNVANLKVPCALMAMDKANVKSQTEEGEVIAGISVAVSSIVTVIIVFLGMLVVKPLQPILQAEALQPALQNVMPALFGALGAYWISKQWKLAIVPITVTVLIFGFAPIPSGVDGLFIPVMGLLSVISARQMYKKGFIKAFNE